MSLLVPTGRMRIRKIPKRPKNQGRAPREAPGRPLGKPRGSWTDDLASLSKTLFFCTLCLPKFNAKRQNYYIDRRFPYCMGRCDACREWTRGKLLIHEGKLSDSESRLRPGQCWTPV